MKYESLIFDIDGTLWDSRQIVAEGYNLQLHDEGMDDRFVTAEILRPLFGKVMTEIADALFGDLPPAERYALMDRCMERENAHIAQHCRDFSYEGVKQALTELSKTHRLFIVSNSQCGYPELCMKFVGLEGIILDHLCFGDTGTTKGETIRRLMEKNCISSAAYVGDTQGDRDAARDAGIDFIWASYGFGSPSDYDLKIDSPMDLAEKKDSL